MRLRIDTRVLNSCTMWRSYLTGRCISMPVRTYFDRCLPCSGSSSASLKVKVNATQSCTQGHCQNRAYPAHRLLESHSSVTVLPSCNLSTSTDAQESDSAYLECDDPNTKVTLARDMRIVPDFVSEEEEQSLFDEIEPYLKRLRYENNHWDDAIHGYRETERKKWTEKNMKIIQRIRDIAFPEGVSQMTYVHVLDLSTHGYIKPHVDAVRFCGDTIAGISLLSSSIMRLVNTEDKTKCADFHLKQRSLYIMKNDARYKFTHEILPEEHSVFRGEYVPRDRRISIICRNNP